MLEFWPEDMEKAADEAYSLDVEVRLDAVGQMAAGRKQAFDFNMPPDWPTEFDDSVYSWNVYREAVQEAWDIYDAMGFELEGIVWSESSSYFKFRPRMYNGKLGKAVNAHFRVSDHTSGTWSEGWTKRTLRLSFVFCGDSGCTPDDFLKRWADIGQRLSMGDYSKPPLS